MSFCISNQSWTRIWLTIALLMSPMARGYEYNSQQSLPTDAPASDDYVSSRVATALNNLPTVQSKWTTLTSACNDQDSTTQSLVSQIGAQLDLLNQKLGAAGGVAASAHVDLDEAAAPIFAAVKESDRDRRRFDAGAFQNNAGPAKAKIALATGKYGECLNLATDALSITQGLQTLRSQAEASAQSSDDCRDRLTEFQSAVDAFMVDPTNVRDACQLSLSELGSTSHFGLSAADQFDRIENITNEHLADDGALQNNLASQNLASQLNGSSYGDVSNFVDPTARGLAAAPQRRRIYTNGLLQVFDAETGEEISSFGRVGLYCQLQSAACERMAREEKLRASLFKNKSVGSRKILHRRVLSGLDSQ